MKKTINELEKLLKNTDLPEETKELIKKLLDDDAKRQKKLAEEIERIIKNLDILNSEGTIIGITLINKKLFLKIKKERNNEYVYFPIEKSILIAYFDGKVTTRELLTSSNANFFDTLDDLSFINEYYTNINTSLKSTSINEILEHI